MKYVSLVILALMLPSVCKASQPQLEHYKIYEYKVKKCIAVEQNKPNIDLNSLVGFATDAIAKSIFYHKDKRIIDCSAKEELDSLARSLASNSLGYEEIKHMYLSIGFLDKEDDYYKIPSNIRAKIDLLLENRNLEVDLLSLFEELENHGK